MGIEGVEKSTMKMETLQDPIIPMELTTSLTELSLEALCLGGLSGLNLDQEIATCAADEKLLKQAQALLKKSEIYQSVDEILQRAYVFQPNVYNNLLSTSADDDQVTQLHRDTAVGNLRFLNIFYGYSPSTFALAVNLLDRLLGKVTAHPKYLSCIATCCFYIAARTVETQLFIPGATELIKLSQCGGNSSDLGRMERLILEKLQWELNAITPLTFLHLFYELLVPEQLSGQNAITSVIAKLEVLMCHFEFTKFRAETMALGLLSHWLEEKGYLTNMEQITPLLEIQYYCQISDGELMMCRGMVMNYLAMYGNQPSKLPRLQLQWTVSRRTLTKLKPSTRCILDLEPIMEDEDGSDNDAGLFDSENDDSELQRALQKKYNASLAAKAVSEPVEDAAAYKRCSHCPVPAGRSVLDMNQNNSQMSAPI